MERKRSIKSNKKTTRLSSPAKKNSCSLCKIKQNNALAITHSLYRKYSFAQSHYYLVQFNSLDDDKLSQTNSTAESQEEQYLSRYFKKTSRKQTLQRLREVYGMHRQVPRIFHPSIKEILVKCHHRKRLIEYFRIAKVLGIKVQSVNFSSFLLSLSLPGQSPKQPFNKVLVDFSVSGDVQRGLLRQIGMDST